MSEAEDDPTAALEVPDPPEVGEAPSSVDCCSETAPRGVVWNSRPLRRSRNVSKITAKLSLRKMFWPSRRMSLATSCTDGSCQHRALT